MRFWQAVVTAQMCAGLVWADKFIGDYWLHMVTEFVSLAVGAISWVCMKYAFKAWRGFKPSSRP